MRSLTSVILKNSKRRELTNTSKFLSIISKLIVAGSLILLMVGFSVVETKRLMEITFYELYYTIFRNNIL